jgi:FtsZ-binding cell division protein ZapB
VKKNREAGQMPLAGTEEGEILSRLSERVERAVGMIQELRRERDALKSRLEKTDAELKQRGESASKVSTLEQECERFRKERDEIRSRVESMLSSLEALET